LIQISTTLKIERNFRFVRKCVCQTESWFHGDKRNIQHEYVGCFYDDIMELLMRVHTHKSSKYYNWSNNLFITYVLYHIMS